MNFTSTKMTLAISAMSAALWAPMATSAADNKPARTDAAAMPATTQSRIAYSDREQMKPWSNAKEVLERELKPGQNKAFYAKALADRGFQITSINSDEREAVEYEVVKGNQSYEVQIEFDNAGKATEVEIAPNVWRTDATKAALRGDRVPVATTFQPGNEAYRDRARMPTWSVEKERMEASLEPGNAKGFYSDQLKRMGYQVTSINDNDRDYVEYEVVKGTESFEVQIDLERGKATNVDVTTNLWQSDATERALEAAGR